MFPVGRKPFEWTYEFVKSGGNGIPVVIGRANSLSEARRYVRDKNWSITASRYYDDLGMAQWYVEGQTCNGTSLI